MFNTRYIRGLHNFTRHRFHKYYFDFTTLNTEEI